MSGIFSNTQSIVSLNQFMSVFTFKKQHFQQGYILFRRGEG